MIEYVRTYGGVLLVVVREWWASYVRRRSEYTIYTMIILYVTNSATLTESVYYVYGVISCMPDHDASQARPAGSPTDRESSIYMAR